MKRKILSILLASALALVLLFSGCFPSGQSDAGNTLDSLGTEVAALRTRLDAAAVQLDVATRDIARLQEELDGASTPDLSNYVTLAQYNDLLAKYTVIEAKVKALEGSGGSIPSTGDVTVELVEESPLQISSAGSGLTTARFTVRITNGTGDWQYVKYSLDLDLAYSNQPDAKADVDVTGSPTVTNLTTPDYPTVAYSTICYPTPATGVDSISIRFMPDTRIAVKKNTTTELDYWLAIRLVGAGATAYWDGILSGISVSDTQW